MPIDEGHLTSVHLIRAEQLLALCANRGRHSTQVFIDVLLGVAYRVAHIERFAPALAHSARPSADAVNDACDLGEIAEPKQLQAHAAVPASRAASTRAAAFGGSSSVGTSRPPRPRERPNSCLRYHSGTPVDTSDHGMMPFGFIEPR